MRLTITAVLAVVLFSCSAFGQGSPGPAKHFNRDGLQFDYPNGWVLQDTSNGEAQQLTLAYPDSYVQIRVFAYGKRLITPERIAEARRVLVDPYVNATAKQFEQMGARPERTPASLDVGSTKFDGVKIAAMLDEPGAAEIYWAVVSQRLMVLTFFGPDKARKQATSAWDGVKNSLRIEAPVTPETQKPAGKPVDKPKPE